MFHVTERQSNYYYFCDGEMPSPEIQAQIFMFSSEAFMINQQSADSRNILVTFNPGRYFLEHLFWKDPTDLRALDEKVKAGTYTDADFASSVKTSFEELQCQQCKKWFNALSIMGGSPYPGAPDLDREKLVLFNGQWKKCPYCHSGMRRTIVKIF